MNEEYHHTLTDLKSRMTNTEFHDVLGLLAENFTPSKRISILDIGSGDMAYALKIANYFSSLSILCDLDAVDIYFPKTKVKIPKNVSLNRFIGDFGNLDLTGPYNIISSRHSIYYLGNIHDALRKMSTLLRKDGVLIITSWDESCILRKLCAEIDPSNPAIDITSKNLAKIGLEFGLVCKHLTLTGEIDLAHYFTSIEMTEALGRFVSRGMTYSTEVVFAAAQRIIGSTFVRKRVVTVSLFKFM